MRIQVSPGELDAGRLQDETVEAAVDALFGDGYVVLGDVVEHAALDLLRRRLEEDTAELLRRIEAEGRTFEPAGQLSQPMPRSPEHVHRTIVANPLVIQVTKEVLGEGVHNHFYNCNTNLPGSRAQFLHRDAPNLGLDPAHPMVSIIVNVSMGDVDESNGATEIWPGTHWVEGSTRVPDAAAARRRAVAPPTRMLFQKGDAVLRDPRLWHRGVPNPSTEVRHMVAMVHSGASHPCDTALPVPRASLRCFDDEVLRTSVVVVDDDYDYLSESLHLR